MTPNRRVTLASHIERRKFLATLGGAAAGWPRAARGQQVDRMRRIGVLAAHERHVPEFAGLRDQLRELGYVEGRNFLIDWRYAAQGSAQLPVLAKELVDLHPDVIVAITTPATAAVKYRLCARDAPCERAR
jgi:putative tryptophan/tyrosine transport system substrate-binding protein